MFWKEWAGYYAVRCFTTCHEKEYVAIRHAAALQDVSPLHKYQVRGEDAASFLSRILVRSAAKLKVGQVAYVCWCDQQGKVIDDGTISRYAPDHFLVTAAEPCLFWFARFARGFRVTIEDVTDQIGVLSLQGPQSREILKQVTDVDVDALRFFRVAEGKLAGAGVRVSRTGYTGDLGYEVWCDRGDALEVWDALWDAGHDRGLEANGLDALDVTRVEAGFIMNGVDYYSAHQCMIEARKSSPYELGLGWTVKLGRETGKFVGQEALEREQAEGSPWAFVGLEICWEDLERRFAAHDLPPQVPHGAWRTPACLYDPDGEQVGRATSGAWSPILKKNLALASLRTPWAVPGTELRIEWMVEFKREWLRCWVRETPFFDPERKKA